MSGTVNKVIIIGRLAKDPDIKSVGDGRQIGNLVVVTSEQWKDKNGERKEKAEFHKVAIFNEMLVDLANKYLSKGSKVYLEGKLQTRKWQDNSGKDNYVTEVVLQGYGSSMTLLDSREKQAEDVSQDDLNDQIPF